MRASRGGRRRGPHEEDMDMSLTRRTRTQTHEPYDEGEGDTRPRVMILSCCGMAIL